MTSTTERRIYRGRSLDELLPQIRADLGPDAIVTRQRDGVVGGFGGFFGRKLVEVEAEAPPEPPRAGRTPVASREHRVAPAPGLDEAPLVPAMPRRTILDAYDSNGTPSPADALAESPLLAPLLEQSAPFAEHLSAADRRYAAATATAAEPSLREVDLAPVVEAPDWAQPDLLLARTPARKGKRSRVEKLAIRLAEAGVPAELALELAGEAERHVRPFGAGEPFAAAVRRTLARRIPVEYGWSSETRTIAVVGAPGAGKTTAAAKIANAYVHAGTVAGVELLASGSESRLAGLLNGGQAAVATAATPLEALRAMRTFADARVVVVDTPGVGPFDVERRELLADALEAIAPDEIHLVVPSTAAPTAIAMQHEALAGAAAPTRLLVSNLDAQGPLGGALGLAIVQGLPVSYLGSGGDPAGGLRPADATELAALVIVDAESEAAA